MANTFGTDILLQAKDPMKGANFYVKELGFEITDKNPKMVGSTGHTSIYSLSPARLWARFWKLL
jgi:hypothetical protein